MDKVIAYIKDENGDLIPVASMYDADGNEITEFYAKKTDIEGIEQTANEAKTTAGEAAGSAQAAQEQAESASAEATQAASDAQDAARIAQELEGKVDEAVSAANEAVSAANAANETAEAASEAAGKAQETADGKLDKASADELYDTLGAAADAESAAKSYADIIDLDIESVESEYKYTFTFTKADGETVTETIDLPIEEFVLSASYSDGKLTISLKNGESVTVDISALISGLASDDDLAEAKEALEKKITDAVADVESGDIVAGEATHATRADTATTADKLGTATVGGETTPIYLNAGTATASTSTAGDDTHPVYLNGGTLTAAADALAKASDIPTDYLTSADKTELEESIDDKQDKGNYVTTTTSTGNILDGRVQLVLQRDEDNTNNTSFIAQDGEGDEKIYFGIGSGTHGESNMGVYRSDSRLSGQWLIRWDKNNQAQFDPSHSYGDATHPIHFESGTPVASTGTMATTDDLSAYLTTEDAANTYATKDDAIGSFNGTGTATITPVSVSGTEKTSFTIDNVANATNATNATQLDHSVSFQTNLASASATSSTLSGSSLSAGVTGTLPVGNGGTGQTSLDSVTVGAATTATKLGSSTVGSSTKPIYLSSGTATACSDMSGAFTGAGKTESETVNTLSFSTLGGGSAIVDLTAATSEKAGLMSAEDKANLDVLVGTGYDETLENNSWEKISEASKKGIAKNLWTVGDCKSVTISGTMGAATESQTLYVYILGFDHNSSLEGSNTIHFGGFKTASGEDGIDVCLVYSYGSSSTGGTKYFNMNHWGNYNRGGWQASDMRYDILGSTDVAQTDYGSSRSTPSSTSANTGQEPTSLCAVNPVEGTLMSCLPAELRAVMRPMTKYTDNIGASTGSVETNISATTDYLPLLAEFEVHGARTYANSYEQYSQQQYDYYANGNDKVKRYDTDAGTTATWWSRSPYYNDTNTFCSTYTSGTAIYTGASYSRGVAPAFCV